MTNIAAWLNILFAITTGLLVAMIALNIRDEMELRKMKETAKESAKKIKENIEHIPVPEEAKKTKAQELKDENLMGKFIVTVKGEGDEYGNTAVEFNGTTLAGLAAGLALINAALNCIDDKRDRKEMLQKTVAELEQLTD